MIVGVADTSPINYLVQIGAVDVLPRFFDEIVLPNNVHQELLHRSTPEAVQRWVSRLPAWIVVRSATCVLPLNLDPGETEAIVLAKELRAFAVLLDDGEARQMARREGLHVTGTIGILERAAAANLIDLRAIVAKLKTTTFHASPELLQAALARDAARNQ